MSLQWINMIVLNYKLQLGINMLYPGVFMENAYILLKWCNTAAFSFLFFPFHPPPLSFFPLLFSDLLSFDCTSLCAKVLLEFAKENYQDVPFSIAIVLNCSQWNPRAYKLNKFIDVSNLCLETTNLPPIKPQYPHN